MNERMTKVVDYLFFTIDLLAEEITTAPYDDSTIRTAGYLSDIYSVLQRISEDE